MRKFPLPFLLCLFTGAFLSADESDLQRLDPFAESPSYQVGVLGNPRVGMISLGTERIARVGKSDYWLLDRSRSHPDLKIALVQLDREKGECLTRQVLAAGGNWCFSGTKNLLFAGRTEVEVSREAMDYSCFELKSNRRIWGFDQKRKVLASTFSADHRFVIVLASVVGEEEDESQGACSAVWLDASSGQIAREVKIEGTTQFNRPTSIEDSKHGTYLARPCEEGNRCFFIAPKSEQAEALDEKLDLSGGESLYWTIHVQPGEEKWVTFHQSQRMTLFEQKEGRLVKSQKVESGGSMFANDDCSNVRFSPEGDRLVVGSDYRTFIIDLKKPDRVEKELGYGTFYSDFTSDGEFLIFWDGGGGWPVRTKDWVNLRTERAKEAAFHCCPIETVSVSPDGKMIATTDYERILIWTVGTGKLLAELTSPRAAAGDKCLIHLPAWNMKGRAIYAGDGYDILEWKLAEIINNTSVKRLKGEVAFGAVKSRSTRPVLIDVCVDKTGEHLAEIRPKSIVYRRLSNASASRKLSLGKRDLYSHPRQFAIHAESESLFVSTSSDCYKIDLTGKVELKRLAYGFRGLSSDSFIAMFGKTKGEETELKVQSLLDDKAEGLGITLPEKFRGEMIISADGKKAAYLSSSLENRFAVKLIDLEKKQLVAELPANAQIASLAFSPDGRFLILGGYHRTAYVWDLSKIDTAKK